MAAHHAFESHGDIGPLPTMTLHATAGVTLSMRAALEASLERALPDASGRLGEAAAYVVLAPGNRLRPLLCLHACAAAGGDWADALPFATAIELVHAMSLVHDDLPAMDAATERRGRPCCHIRFGEALAILAGDALLAHAFGWIARHPPPRAPHVAADLVLLSGACAFEGLAGGQALELASSGPDPVSAATAATIANGKTAALFRAAAEGGARVALASAGVAECLARFGKALGGAFQAVDDCLDHRPDLTGKTGGRDAAHGRPSLVRLQGYANAHAAAKAAIEAACAELSTLGASAGPLLQIARSVEESLAVTL